MKNFFSLNALFRFNFFNIPPFILDMADYFFLKKTGDDEGREREGRGEGKGILTVSLSRRERGFPVVLFSTRRTATSMISSRIWTRRSKPRSVVSDRKLPVVCMNAR